jgi:hypothetical protein
MKKKLRHDNDSNVRRFYEFLAAIYRLKRMFFSKENVTVVAATLDEASIKPYFAGSRSRKSLLFPNGYHPWCIRKRWQKIQKQLWNLFINPIFMRAIGDISEYSEDEREKSIRFQIMTMKIAFFLFPIYWNPLTKFDSDHFHGLWPDDRSLRNFLQNRVRDSRQLSAKKSNNALTI